MKSGRFSSSNWVAVKQYCLSQLVDRHDGGQACGGYPVRAARQAGVRVGAGRAAARRPCPRHPPPRLRDGRAAADCAADLGPRAQRARRGGADAGGEPGQPGILLRGRRAGHCDQGDRSKLMEDDNRNNRRELIFICDY